jgi:ribonuclease D
MVVQQRLPEKLMMLLQNPRVRKVGCMVSSDLKQLQTSVNSSLPFVGALDLANYAKQRHVISNARCSLSDLCAAVLGKRLNKNVSERTSAAWEHLSLTTEQQNYAAIDAYVPLLLYHELSPVYPHSQFQNAFQPPSRP